MLAGSINFETLKHESNLQHLLRVHPERRRAEHPKDWTVENTGQVDWDKLGVFMLRHAKAFEGFIQETFV